MKNFVFISLFMACLVCPTTAAADMKLLIEYDGNEHKVVKAYKVPVRQVRNKLTVPASPQSLPLKNQMELSWVGEKGKASQLIEDPRLRWAPFFPDDATAQGHGAPHISEKGAYIITLKDDDVDLNSLKLTFTGTNKSIPITVDAKLKP